MPSEFLAEQAKKFSRLHSLDEEGRVKDRQEGAAIFLRLNDRERLDLIASMIEAWACYLPLNRPMISGALRHAWDSEPYINGGRLGSYVSAVAHCPGGEEWTMQDFVEDWGPDLMTADEHDQLNAMEFPLTVYRGGAGDFDELADGVSWTLNFEIASFYATTWPKSWGNLGQPLILSMTIESEDVAAFLNDRKEEELLIPDVGRMRESMRIVDQEQTSAATA